jgi:SAM-dependent methyltransferase/uncharacterized protein YbaR (Trm112 family)
LAVGNDLALSSELREILRCPVCGASLMFNGNEIRCAAATCGARFPITSGIPVLLNDSTSVFSADQLLDRGSAEPSLLWQALHVAARRMPSNGRNLVAAKNFPRFGQLLLEESARPLVLVVGGRVAGQGMDGLLSNDKIEFVETDVDFGPRTRLICDAHDLPFADRSFDGVIIQAVLEHVADPYRAVEEIHRVLKDNGLVYAETPFMQQVHGGRHDFTRFTHLGHRRLFRRFAEIDSGAAGGSGMALAWSYEYFLLSFFRRRLTRGLVRGFSRLTGFWLKYFDTLSEGNPGALDAASGYFFLGRRSEETLSDRELVKLYRGPQREIRI